MSRELTTTEVRAEFFSPDAMLDQPEPLFRIDGGDRRYYYKLSEEGTPEFFISVTSLIDATLPKSPFLIDWIRKNGEEGTNHRDERAAYGTMLHILVSKMLIARKLDVSLNRLSNEIGDAVAGHLDWLRLDWYAWVPKLQSDLLAIAQWARDCNVRPIAVEVVLSGNEWGENRISPDMQTDTAFVDVFYAGAIDLVCEMDVCEAPEGSETGNGKRPKKETKRVTAIVDFKSGGIYESHICQLELYKRLWEATYPEKPIERLYNLSPKDWRTSPTYTLKDQTNEPYRQLVPHLLGMWSVLGTPEPAPRREISGVIDLADAAFDLNSLVSIVEVARRNGEEVAL